MLFIFSFRCQYFRVPLCKVVDHLYVLFLFGFARNTSFLLGTYAYNMILTVKFSSRTITFHGGPDIGAFNYSPFSLINGKKKILSEYLWDNIMYS